MLRRTVIGKIKVLDSVDTEAGAGANGSAASDQLIAGRYELTEWLGAGGMGVVYRARDIRSQDEVALKLVHDGARRAGSTLTLQHEFRSMCQLAHPNLTKVHDYGETRGGQPFFAMELVEGVDLDKAEELTFDEVRWILGRVARALAFIHSRGMVHRDIKPSNIRLLPASEGASTRFTAVKVMDLGTMTHAGARPMVIAGTPSYLPPEAVFGGAIEHRSDLYSLGVVAYELCVGRLPRRVHSLNDLLDINYRELIDPRDLQPEIPEDIYLLIVSLLAINPTDRPFDAAEVAARLGAPLQEASSSEQGAYLTTAACVGRDKELSALREQWQAAREGKAGGVVVRGRAGAGKTRLVREFLVEAKIDGAHVFETACRDQVATPFGVMRALLEPLADVPGTRQRLREIEEASAVARILPGVASWELPLPPARDYVDPAFARERALEVAAAWLAAVSRGHPIVLVVDDVQWSDAGSLDALNLLLRQQPEACLLIVATERIEEGVAGYGDLFGHFIDLQPLGERHIRDLLAAMFGATEPSDALVRYLHATSRGNAYFLVELVRSLQTSQQIRRHAGSWQLPLEPRVDRLPASLEEAIDRRIERLSPDARRVADAVCVLESDLTTQRAKSLSGLDNERLFDAVDELLAAELLVGSEGQYRFRHARCHERLYTILKPNERKRRHLSAATMLRDELGDDDTYAAEIGEHFAKAGEAVLAVEHLLRGADLLWESQAYADLHRPLELARSLLDDGDDRKLLVVARLGRANFYSNHVGAEEQFQWLRNHYMATGVFRWLPRLSRIAGKRIALFIVLVSSWFACLLRGRRKTFKNLVDSLLEVFTNTTFLCSSQAYAGDLVRSVETAKLLDPLVTSKKTLPYAGRMVSEVTATGHQGELDRSAFCCREALATFARDHETPIDGADRAMGECGALTALANTYLWRGRSAQETLDKLQTRVDSSELFFVNALYHQVALWQSINHGTLEEADSQWNNYLAFYRRVGHVPLIEVLNRLWLARAYVANDRLREAHDIAQQVVERKIENRFVNGITEEILGQVQLAWGKRKDAHRHMQAALEHGEHPAVQSALVRMRGCIGLGLVAVANGDATLGLSHAAAALELATSDRYRNEAEEASALRLRARALASDGRRKEALDTLERARSIAEQLGSPLQRHLNERTTARVTRRARPRTPVGSGASSGNIPISGAQPIRRTSPGGGDIETGETESATLRAPARVSTGRAADGKPTHRSTNKTIDSGFDATVEADHPSQSGDDQ